MAKIIEIETGTLKIGDVFCFRPNDVLAKAGGRMDPRDASSSAYEPFVVYGIKPGQTSADTEVRALPLKSLTEVSVFDLAAAGGSKLCFFPQDYPKVHKIGTLEIKFVPAEG